LVASIINNGSSNTATLPRLIGIPPRFPRANTAAKQRTTLGRKQPHIDLKNSLRLKQKRVTKCTGANQAAFGNSRSLNFQIIDIF